MKKEEKAQFLFDELGGIDDDLLYESSGRPLMVIKDKQRKRKTVRRLSVFFAAAVVFFMLTTVAIGLSRSGTGTEPIDAPTENDAAHALLFDKNRRLFWEKDGKTYSVEISAETYVTLLSETIKGGTETTGTQSVKVWFSDGKGTVITPFLRYSSGNIGYGTLFDYEVEQTPSEKLIAELQKLTGEKFSA